MTRKAPSVLKIIRGDYSSFYCTLILILVAGLSLYLFLMEESISGDWLGLLLVIWITTIVPFGLLLIRIRLVRHVFLWGEKVQGKIERVRKKSRKGFAVNSQVVFTYRFRGIKYKKSRFLLSADELETGQKISIIADPGKPKRAFIRSAFTD